MSHLLTEYFSFILDNIFAHFFSFFYISVLGFDFPLFQYGDICVLMKVSESTELYFIFL